MCDGCWSHQQHFRIIRCVTKMKKKSITGFLQSTSQSINRGTCVTLCGTNLILTLAMCYRLGDKSDFALPLLAPAHTLCLSLLAESRSVLEPTASSRSTEKTVGKSHKDTTQTFADSQIIISVKQTKQKHLGKKNYSKTIMIKNLD